MALGFWTCIKIGAACSIVAVAPALLARYRALHPLPVCVAGCHFVIPPQEWAPGGMFGPPIAIHVSLSRSLRNPADPLAPYDDPPFDADEPPEDLAAPDLPMIDLPMIGQSVGRTEQQPDDRATLRIAAGFPNPAAMPFASYPVPRHADLTTPDMTTPDLTTPDLTIAELSTVGFATPVPIRIPEIANPPAAAGTTSEARPIAVPEPASLAVLAASLAVLLAFRLRSNAAAGHRAPPRTDRLRTRGSQGERKVFFFAKKQQKTLVRRLARCSGGRAKRRHPASARVTGPSPDSHRTKVFRCFFAKKKTLALLAQRGFSGTQSKQPYAQ